MARKNRGANIRRRHRRRANRAYKDRLFIKIFERREDLLSLYNAVNGSDYQNPDELEITTLDNAIYMRMKNDISFLITDFISKVKQLFCNCTRPRYNAVICTAFSRT